MAITHKNQHESNDNGVKQDKLTNDEVEVAAILLDLPFLITKSLSNYRFDYNWGSKKPRSALNSPPSPPPPTRRKTSPPPPPPPPPVVGLKREAASPNTPLSFSPSDSDSKSHKKPRLFLKKEELEQAVKERLDTQQQLKESIEKVEVYLKSLVAENSKLKATREEMQMNIMGKKKSEKELKVRMTACTTEQEEETSRSRSRTVNDDQVNAVASTSTASCHLTPLIQPHYYHHHQAAAVVFGDNNHNDPMCASPWQLYHPQPSMYHDNQVVTHQHQRQPFDLNLSPEEAEREMRKKETDEARQHRYRIRKEKLTRVRP